jgi:hypothetical protein
MSPQKIHPLRALTEEEQNWLERISRSYSEPAAHVTRAKEILAVAGGSAYQEAAEKAGRKSVKHLHEFIRNGTEKMLTLFHPKTGEVRVKGVTQSTNAILHPWVKD